ncbi:MAG: hypothetical protein ABEJ28_01025 [Salinigranum sp.]
MGEHVDALDEREGWRSQGRAARVHYRGEGARYSVEYYEANDSVVYWRVEEDGEAAVPVDRTSVPDPLRVRIREDLAAAGVDPDVEGRPL